LEYKSLVCSGLTREAIIIIEHGDRSDLIVSNEVEEPTTNARKKASKPVLLDLCTHDLTPDCAKSPRIFNIISVPESFLNQSLIRANSMQEF